MDRQVKYDVFVVCEVEPQKMTQCGVISLSKEMGRRRGLTCYTLTLETVNNGK